MRKKLGTLGTGRPTRWVLAATVLLLLVPAPALARSGPGATGEANGDSSWPSHRPAGWSAGSVARGTGFSLGASARVREVQRKLNRLGYGAGQVDGLFGPITDDAVRRFQRESALPVDGIVGPRTLGQLRSRSERLEGLLREGIGFLKPNGSVRVRSVQRELNQLGYGAGKVDGLFGPVTDRAVRRFQGERGLQVDGIVGPRTLRRLDARTESVKEDPPRPVESRGRSERQPAPHRPPSLDTRDAPLEAPWEGQPFLAQLATIIVLALIVLLTLGALVLAIGRRPAASLKVTHGTPPLEKKPEVASRRIPSGKVNGERPMPIERVGARVLLNPEHRRAQSGDPLRVDLRLFVENEERHWEADFNDARLTAVPVAGDNLQERVRELVVPEGLPRVVAALREQGVDVRSHQLEEVFFVIELARDVERELLKARPNGTA